MNNIDVINSLPSGKTDAESLSLLLKTINDSEREYLRYLACKTALEKFGGQIYIRGLIEISSFCKNDCLYCGIRRSNKNAVRYRLTRGQILSCCARGYALGFRTFVLQGGEDAYYTDDRMCGIVSDIREAYPDCAITLSLGERGYCSFRRLFDAGADRYLLRHETADSEHYRRLHPPELTLESRKEALYQLKELGFQTGAGFMVGSPYQTFESLAADLIFIRELDPQMCGIGPFIPHKDTPFADFPQGSLALTLTLLSIIRLMKPDILLPATTALGTIDPNGRELGILHGANVVMPNLSPLEHRGDYLLYNNKLGTGEEAAEGLEALRARLKKIGYEISPGRGDFVKTQI